MCGMGAKATVGGWQPQQIHGRRDVAVISGVLFSIPMFSLELSNVHVKIKARLAKR